MAQTESNNTENEFVVFGRVPMFTFDMNMKSCIFAHFWCYFTGISVCMYIRYNVHKRCIKETSLTWSDVYVNVFRYIGVYRWILLTSI